MIISENTIIGELVAENYNYSDVFYRNGIDFCCGGNISINDACIKHDFDESKKKGILEELTSYNGNKSKDPMDVTNWPLDFLVDYIEKKHHRYIEEESPIIKQYLAKIANVHGVRHPELIEINSLFKASIDNLIPHMKKEELMFFPTIRKLADKSLLQNQDKIENAIEKTNEIIHHLSDEHEHEGEVFRQIAELTSNYTLPEDACNTYRVAFGKLKAFEEDLHFHIHLENNILFKKVKEKFNELEMV